MNDEYSKAADAFIDRVRTRSRETAQPAPTVHLTDQTHVVINRASNCMIFVLGGSVPQEKTRRKP